jgi:hypothetical protein
LPFLLRQTELAAAALWNRPPTSISTAVVFFVVSSLAEAPTCSEKLLPALFSFSTEP